MESYSLQRFVVVNNKRLIMTEKILVAVLSVVITTIIGLLAYLCKRLIDSNDKNFDSINKKLEKIDNNLISIQKDLHIHDTSLAVINEKIETLDEQCSFLGKIP